VPFWRRRSCVSVAAYVTGVDWFIRVGIKWCVVCANYYVALCIHLCLSVGIGWNVIGTDWCGSFCVEGPVSLVLTGMCCCALVCVLWCRLASIIGVDACTCWCRLVSHWCRHPCVCRCSLVSVRYVVVSSHSHVLFCPFA